MRAQCHKLWKTDNNWLSISIPGGLIDSLRMNSKTPQYPIDEINTVQMNDAAQISFLLKAIPDDFEVTSQNKKIVIKLFTAQRANAQKIKAEKQKYIIDTVVLDAGHGGKDPGACVQTCSIKEKNITLSIVKKIGSKLENEGINVIYTRDDDRFVTLNNRTKIANTNNGDIFISIHANSIANSPQTRGFETYLLRLGKTKHAIQEVEKRENSVIEEYEKNTSFYENFSKINATLLQNANAKQSEDLVHNIQEELSKSLNIKYNRGIKQAGFQILWGVTMPNILIEVGFITNKEEAKNLISKKYQNKIANSIVLAIINYKNKYEQHIIE